MKQNCYLWGEGGMMRVSMCNKKKHRQLIAWFAISFGLGIVSHKVLSETLICSCNNNELRNVPMAKLFISCTGQCPVFCNNSLRTPGSFGPFSSCNEKFQDTVQLRDKRPTDTQYTVFTNGGHAGKNWCLVMKARRWRVNKNCK